MLVVMTLLVRNEEDIIEANLEFHLARGVDRVIVTDNLSDDGTRDMLASYERDGSALVIEETSDDFSQAVWVTRMARMAHDLGADWVINNDADEFWWPEGDDLKSYFSDVPPNVDVLIAHRDNFVPTNLASEAFSERMVYREAVSLNAHGGPLPPKVAHRAHPTIDVAQGNHAATADGLRPPTDLGSFRILHFPVRSYQQFERKVVAGGRALERNTALPASVGSTWRALYAIWQVGGLRAYYDHLLYDEARIRAGLDDGDLHPDTRLRDWLRAHQAQ